MAGWDQSYLCAFGPSNIDGYSTIIYNYNYIQTTCHLWMFRGLRHPSSMLMSPDGVMPPDGNIWQPTVVKTWSTSNPGHLGLPGPVRLALSLCWYWADQLMILVIMNYDIGWYWVIFPRVQKRTRTHRSKVFEICVGDIWWKKPWVLERVYSHSTMLSKRESVKKPD
jgi:hypothetical protein